MKLPSAVRDKHARADFHIKNLNCLARDYWSRTPFQVYREEDSSGDLQYRVRILEQIPTAWSPIVGDAVRNLRSCLGVC